MYNLTSFKRGPLKEFICERIIFGSLSFLSELPSHCYAVWEVRLLAMPAVSMESELTLCST